MVEQADLQIATRSLGAAENVRPVLLKAWSFASASWAIVAPHGWRPPKAAVSLIQLGVFIGNVHLAGWRTASVA